MGGNPNPKGGGGGKAKLSDVRVLDGGWAATVIGEGPCPYKEGDNVLLALDSPANNGDSGASGDA